MCFILFNYENNKINYVKDVVGPNMFEIEFIQVTLAGGIPLHLSFLYKIYLVKMTVSMGYGFWLYLSTQEFEVVVHVLCMV